MAAGEAGREPDLSKSNYSIPEEAWVSLSADEGQGSSNSLDMPDSVGFNSPGTVHMCMCASVCTCVEFRSCEGALKMT